MIIAIYGISRCGKDTFIGEILKKRKGSYHIKGSETLKQLALSHYNKDFKSLNYEEQNRVRTLFVEYAKTIQKEYRLVIVDGHYSFPGENGFKTVFTEDDLNLYDAFFYLNRTPEEITRNFNSGDKRDYKDVLLDPNKVTEWINFEISTLKKVIESKEKDFIVLDSNPFAVEYVSKYRKSTKKKALEIVKAIRDLAGSRNVVLTDLDKTISINDLTNDFIDYSGLNPLTPKKIFKDDYYTDYQFTVFHNYLLHSWNYDESIRHANQKLALNQTLINDITLIKKDSIVVGISTGLTDAWDYRNKSLGLCDLIIGFNNKTKIVVTPFLKKLVSRYLSKTNRVLAIGDSIIDLGMLLEADKGYLISATKLDQRIINYYERDGITKKLFQPKHSLFKYDFLEEDDIKW